MLADNPSTKGLDLGERITLIDGPTVPTTSDLATRLLRTFFIATSPANWQDFTAASGVWHVTYPSVDVRLTGGVVANLAAVLTQRYGNDLPLPRLFKPAIPGVGEVWVDTQFERTAGKEKPGTVTKVDASAPGCVEPRSADPATRRAVDRTEARAHLRAGAPPRAAR